MLKSRSPLIHWIPAVASLLVVLFAPNSLLSQTDYPPIWWVFVSEGGRSDTPVAFSERAIERRHRADLSLDQYDYPISESVLAEIAGTGVVVRHASRWLGAVSVYAAPGQISRLRGLSYVKAVRPVAKWRTSDRVFEVEPKSPPSDRAVDDSQYGLSLTQNQFIRSQRIHEAGHHGEGVLIAMLDTGFDIEHQAFDSVRSRIVATWDFINGAAAVNGLDCPDGNRQNSHGTIVWSVIAGYVPDTLIGVAYGADFALAKTEITCDGTEIRLEEDNWIAAVEWADSLGADLVSTSLGYWKWDDDDNYVLADLNGDSALITRAADMAAAKNMLVITSAGNERGDVDWGKITFPSDGDSVIAVGAVTRDSSLAGFSSPGPSADGRIKPDIATLGSGVYGATAEPYRGYGYSSGTSLAAPLVAGGAALVLQQNPNMTAAELADRIRNTGSMADAPDNDFGYGLFDAYKAADFVRLEPVPLIQVKLEGPPDTTRLRTQGGASVIPQLYALDPPDWVELVDLSDGTGILIVTPDASAPNRLDLAIVADAGFTADTVQAAIETYGQSDDPILIGPNPFSDSLCIHLSPQAGRFVSATIFSVSGEKIWESVNQSGQAADELGRWITVPWDGTNQHGRAVSPGVYLVYVETTNHRTRVKLLKKD
ncbi:MAG: S8 family serine peptidase [bacterium]